MNFDISDAKSFNMNQTMVEKGLLLFTTDQRSEIINGVINWQKQNYPERTSNYEKCRRDLNLVLYAYEYDILGNTERSIKHISAKYWFSGERQVKHHEVELAVHNYMIDLIKTKKFLSDNHYEQIINLHNILCDVIQNGPEFMNYTHLHKFRYVMEYDVNSVVDPFIIKQALHEAWATTPSKQNMMPYNVFIIGPDNKNIRDLIYYKSVQREYKTNLTKYDGVDENDPIAVEKAFLQHRAPPQYVNLKTAPYVLLFTQRVIKKMNPWNQWLTDNWGMNFEQADAVNKNRARSLALLEMGMFSHTFSNLCLMNNIDVSHTRCLPMEPEFWQEPEFSFLNEVPQLVMTAGVGKRFRRDWYPGLTHGVDYKPDFDEVVKFVY